MGKMSKEEVACLITESSKNKVNAMIENLKKDISIIEQEKEDLFSGNKATIGRIRKSAQGVKISAQNLRKLTIEIRNGINKKKK